MGVRIQRRINTGKEEYSRVCGSGENSPWAQKLNDAFSAAIHCSIKKQNNNREKSARRVALIIFLLRASKKTKKSES